MGLIRQHCPLAHHQSIDLLRLRAKRSAKCRHVGGMAWWFLDFWALCVIYNTHSAQLTYANMTEISDALLRFSLPCMEGVGDESTEFSFFFSLFSCFQALVGDLRLSLDRNAPTRRSQAWASPTWLGALARGKKKPGGRLCRRAFELFTFSVACVSERAVPTTPRQKWMIASMPAKKEVILLGH